MTLLELLSALRARDVKLWVDGERLRYSAPSGVMSSELREELAKHKATVFTFLQPTDRLPQAAHTPITKISRQQKLLPSINQRRMWFIEQLEPNTAFNCYRAFRIVGQLGLGSLEQSLNEIVRRHEALRTKFSIEDGQPFQVILPSLDSRITFVDLRGIGSSTRREAEVERLLTEEVEKPFDLANGPLFRVCLFCVNSDEHILTLTIHHIVSDFWSMSIFVNELMALYRAFCDGNRAPLAQLPIQYADFAHWQRQWLQDQASQQGLAYWKQKLIGAPEMTELPADFPRPAAQRFHGGSEPVVISKNLTEALRALGREQDATLFMCLLAALNVLLYRYTGQEDLIVGSPIAGRIRSDIENLIGLFINTLVVRTDLSGEPTFRQLLTRIREVALDAYGHQDVPFEKLLEELHLGRSLSFNPLFQVMFVLQNSPESQLKIAGTTISPVSIQRETGLFDLFLSLIEGRDGLQGKLSYRTGLFERDTIVHMVERFQLLLEAIVADPDRPVSALPLLTETERHRLLVEWNDTAKDYPKDACIHQLFEAQAERVPDSVAVVFKDQRLTYRELNQRANRLARHLQEIGVGPDFLVGICMEPSVETISGLLAILKAGGAYLPLAPEYPKERLAFILGDAQVAVLLTQQHLLSVLPEHGVRIVCLDGESHELQAQSAENPISNVTADNLAYVIYTSGSTGNRRAS